MMPSASIKSDQKPSFEATDPIKTAVNLVEKKVRNLEKRKGKLDAYKKKQDDGEILNQDQVEAVERYDGVTQNLEFARDLQKSFLTIAAEAEKSARKQKKRELLERSATELSRFKQLLQLQCLLDSMGSEQTRDHFMSGKHGAVVLSEENLNQFDELYKLISPSRENGTNFSEELDSAAEHIQDFLEAKDKEVVGTTFQNLNVLCQQVHDCGYFDHPRVDEEEEIQEETSAEVQQQETQAAEEEPAEIEKVEDENTNELSQPETTTEVAAVIPPTPEVIQHQMQEVVPVPTHEQTEEQYEDSFFSTAPPYHKRAFNEIVSSVQGSFNFLQESHLDSESPHIDPAVLAAHPMAGGLRQSPHTEGTMMQQNYQDMNSRLAEDSHQQQQPHAGVPAATNNHHLPEQQHPQTLPSEQLPVYDSMSVTQSQTHYVNTQAIDSAFSNQEYMSHSLQGNMTGLHSVEDSSALGQQMEPAVNGISDGTPAMQMSSQDNQDLTSQNMFSQADMAQSKKSFTMNADAAVFQSMYAQSQQSGSSDDRLQQRDFQDSNVYNNSGFGRGGRGNQRGGRGGQRGAGGMSNGYSRGGSRGGSTGFNNRGGYNNSRGTYQNYSNRTDYRADGYQGYSNGFSSGGFNKRGGGAPPRGSVRGGGGMRGGSGRGGRGGGFGANGRMPSGTKPQQQEASA